MQVERWLSAWIGWIEASQATGNSFSWSYTYTYFILGILFHVTSSGLTPGDLVGSSEGRYLMASQLTSCESRPPALEGSGSSCSPVCRWHPGCARRTWYCDWHGKGFLSAPTFSCTWCDYLTFLKKVKGQADAIPCAAFKFGSMQTYMQVKHGLGDLGCCQGNTVYSLFRQLHNCSPETA